MKLKDVVATPGARPKPFRKGRGHGSGSGKTAGRGHKGQNARSGGGVRPQFEGGQMPLYRRLPKRGFSNKRFAKQYLVVNVEDLNVFEDGALVNLASVKDANIISVPLVNDGLKVLGNGDLQKKLTVEAKAFTASAREKIEKAGGEAKEI